MNLGDLGVAQFVHDVRNHLSLIILSAERLLQSATQNESVADLLELRQSAERASLLARELLTAARPRLVARDRLDVNEVIAHTVARPGLLGRRIRLQLRLSPTPVIVSAEPLELERILLNIVLNAREAMPAGGTMTVETTVIHHSASASIEGLTAGPFVRVIVRDTGVGMEPEVKDRIFEPFFTTKKAGTGLGMSSVGFTVRQLQGIVSVESRPGRGTSVSVFLPWAR